MNYPPMEPKKPKKCIIDIDDETAYPYSIDDTPEERDEKTIKQSQEQAAKQRAVCNWLFGI